MSAEADSEKWRGKYLDSLGELERKEKAWHHTEEVLRHCLSRLTIAAEVEDSPLAAELERLREALRRGQPSTELEGMMQSLSEHILQLDKQRRTQPRSGPRETLAAVIEALSFPKGLGRRRKAVLKRLKARGEAAEPAELAQEVAGLIAEAFEWLAGQSEGQGEGGRRGLLGRLVGGRGPAPEAAAGGEAPADTGRAVLTRLLDRLIEPDSTEGKLLYDHLAQARVEEELLGVTEQLAGLLEERLGGFSLTGALVSTPPTHEVLIQLLERLAVPDELGDRVEEIKALIGDGFDQLDAQGAIARIADLVTDMRMRVQREKEEIERFLLQLTESLKDLDINIQSTVARQLDAARDGRNLDAAVQDQMRGIEDSMQAEQDVDGLKLAIQSRLRTIREHMEIFRKAEEDRGRKAEQEVVALRERLQEMERESAGLREKIQDERQQALSDPLTGIPNRLAYNERIEQEFARWKRYGSPLVLSVWDVDRFKGINDTYGHQAGDKVLRVIAKLLNTQTRETDFAARFGGEEFVILLPETTLEEARTVVDKLRTSIEQAEFHYRQQRVAVTISCGLTALREGDGIEEAFARADDALYRAKEAGRNRCELVE